MGDKIGIVTGGGDCPGLNAVIRAVAKAASYRGWETLGVLDGFDGLLEPRNVMPLRYEDLGGLLTRGGTILGTASRGQFSAKVGHGETIRLPDELLERTRQGCEDLGIVGLVVLGGDGTMTIAQQLHEHGIPIVGAPKTIDNDLPGTIMTFGFDSAVACATDAVDRLHTTAESHDRVMVLEVMGRYTGWIAIFAGVAGGADVILVPEIPFRYGSVCERIERREAAGKGFSIVVVAEGAKPEGGDYVAEASSAGEAHLGGIGEVVAKELAARTGKEARATVLGHLQRGGSPTMLDRVLCTLYGTKAVEMIAEGEFGRMVVWQGREFSSVPLAEVMGNIKTVPLDGALVKSARALGISLGD